MCSRTLIWLKIYITLQNLPQPKYLWQIFIASISFDKPMCNMMIIVQNLYPNWITLYDIKSLMPIFFFALVALIWAHSKPTWIAISSTIFFWNNTLNPSPRNPYMRSHCHALCFNRSVLLYINLIHHGLSAKWNRTNWSTSHIQIIFFSFLNLVINPIIIKNMCSFYPFNIILKFHFISRNNFII